MLQTISKTNPTSPPRGWVGYASPQKRLWSTRTSARTCSPTAIFLWWKAIGRFVPRAASAPKCTAGPTERRVLRQRLGLVNPGRPLNVFSLPQAAPPSPRARLRRNRKPRSTMLRGFVRVGPSRVAELLPSGALGGTASVGGGYHPAPGASANDEYADQPGSSARTYPKEAGPAAYPLFGGLGVSRRRRPGRRSLHRNRRPSWSPSPRP